MRAKTDEAIDLLRYSVSTERFAHCRRVAATCADFGERYGVDSAVCEFVGWAHDIAREWPPDSLLSFTMIHDGENIEAMERRQPVLLHGRVGSLIVENELSVRDKAVLEAIRHHTLGKAEFSTLGKILFCADYLEPGRTSVSASLREQSSSLSLDGLVLKVVADTEDRGFPIADKTRAMVAEIEGTQL